MKLVNSDSIGLEQDNESHSLKFAPSILARLGEELLPNFDQGIIELVRNAYDADAQTCTVSLINISQPGGTILISDDGKGMNKSSIINGWLVLGYSEKRSAGVTQKGRVQVGDKGLGRLAALRMGTIASLKSRPKYDNSSNIEYSTTLAWELFDRKSTIDEVKILVSTDIVSQNFTSGTDIEIKNIKKKINKSEAERLARSLMLLSNPFDEGNDFKLKFCCPDYPELEKLVNKGYLDEAEYILKADLNGDGYATAKVLDWKKDVIWEVKSDDWFLKNKEKSPVYKAPTSSFELSIFQLENSSFATRNINRKQVSIWLKSVGGVHIYHNDFRVHPYGDSGYDWLDMNLARVNNPTIRPSTNNSIGRVNIYDKEKRLKQKTDRVGFIEDEIFLELKRFIQDSLDWYANKRSTLAEQKRKAERDKDAEDVESKNKKLQEAINSVSDKRTKDIIRQAVRDANTASEKHARHLKEDLKLYRSLATAGTITAVFSHEVSKPVSEIPLNLESAEKVVRNNCDELTLAKYKSRTKNIIGYLERLGHFSQLQLDLLKRNKRRNGVINVNDTISSLISNFSPLLKREKIDINFIFDKITSPKLNGSTCILESIVSNCITNSMKAFQSNGFHVDKRRIELSIHSVGESFILEIHDNGPGIRNIGIEEIWIPGRTTVDNGTGFGLTIVKDSVADLGGSCRVEANGKLGGAAFYFEFQNL